MNSIKIEDFQISDLNPSFIIAEAGVNHNCDLSMAKKLCDVAKNAGANAVKFQTWKTDQLITAGVPTARYQKQMTTESSQEKMLQALELPFEDFVEISNYCKKIGIIFLSTPGDKESVDFLESLKMSAYKIGSDDFDNLPLLEYVAQKGKPLILSTGMSTMQEVIETFEFVKKLNQQIIFLHCTSCYPTSIKDVNFNSMVSMKKKLGTLVGYSDHTTRTWTPLVATCLGSKLIEKHLTLNKNLPGPDHKSSLNIEEFETMVKLIRKGEKKMKNLSLDKEKIISICEELIDNNVKEEILLTFGSNKKKPVDSEKPIMMVVKKTIVAANDISKGQKLTNDNLAIKRAGKIAINPRQYFDILGKTVKKNLKKNEVIYHDEIA